MARSAMGWTVNPGRGAAPMMTDVTGRDGGRMTLNETLIEVAPPLDADHPGPRASRPSKDPLPTASDSESPHKGWHSRGYLPHCDAPDLIQSITFRLADSLPSDVARRLAETADDAKRRKKFEAYLNAGHGACWLRRDDLAAIVENALLHFDGDRYRLLAWCVMPNHVHALIEMGPGHPLADVVHSWKSFTAKEINPCLGRTGTVWAADYFDRYIRDEAHLAGAVAYIESNPVKAGLVARNEDWARSSAARRAVADGTGWGWGARGGAGAGGTPAVPGDARLPGPRASRPLPFQPARPSGAAPFDEAVSPSRLRTLGRPRGATGAGEAGSPTSRRSRGGVPLPPA